MSARLLVSHWQPSWSLNLLAIACAALYLSAARHAPGRWPAGRTASFLGGLACVVIALESGIAGYDDRLLSVHMVQHLLLLLLAPVLLLSGQPVLLALRAFSGPRRRGLARALARLAPLTGPWPCLAVFTAVVLATHLPVFYEATLRRPALHEAEHLAYLAAGLLMWWPLLGVDPVPAHRLGGLGRLVYMLATMPAMALLGAYLNRHPSLVYPAYGPPARALGVSALADQQQAGAIMWVAGSTLVVAIGLWAVTAALVAEEHRQRNRDARAPEGRAWARNVQMLDVSRPGSSVEGEPR